jgi:hypothetical protein
MGEDAVVMVDEHSIYESGQEHSGLNVLYDER